MTKSPRGMRYAAAAAIACGALTMSACAGSTESTADGPADLVMAVWTTNDKHLALFDEIADAYIAEHRDEVSSITFQPLAGTYLTTLTTQIAGGSTPDLAWVAEANATEFVKNGVLLDVADYFKESADFDLGDVVPSSLALWSNNGGIYAYPFSTSPFGVFVNRDLVAAAGQTQPADLLAEDKWTWDAATQIASAAAAATPGTGPIVIGTAPDKQWDGLTTVWAGWNATPWDAAGTTCTLDSVEMTDAVTWYHDQVYSAAAFAKPGETFSFGSGGSAMLIAQMSSSGGIDESMDWDFLPLPAGPAGQADVVGQAAIGVIAKSAHPEAAANFLTYFTGAQNAAKLAQFFPAPRTSLLTVDTLQQAAPALSAEQIQTSVIDAIPDAITKANSIVYSQVSPVIQTTTDALWTPDADVAQVLNDVCTAIQPALETSAG